MVVCGAVSMGNGCGFLVDMIAPLCLWKVIIEGLPGLLGLRYLQLRRTWNLTQFAEKIWLLSIGETIIASFSVHFIQCPWVIFSHGHHTCVGWDIPVCCCSSLCTPVVDPWSIFHLATQRVYAWVFILSSPYGTTVTLATHDVGPTLGLLLHLNYMALDPLVEDGLGVQICAQWPFGMWISEF